MSDEPDVTQTHPARVDSATARPSAELPLGDPHHFVVGHEHARGGLGRIVVAHDRVLDRPVAIKQLLAPGSDPSARFMREAMITARLQHPAIVPVYEAGRWADGEPYYVMKLVAGRSLKEAIAAAGDVHARVALLPHVITVAEAIAYAHRHEVVHRDLKPSNVVLGEFGETVVIDWGLAIAAGDAGDAEARAVVGTPNYMPPEQARGERVDERADVYALGAMLYQLLAGKPPYDGARGDVVARVIAGPPADVRALEPAAPVELAAIVARAMARDPAARYASARALADDLARFRTGELVGSHRYSAWSLIARWVRRHRVPVALSALFAVALAIGGGASVARIAAARRAAEERRNHLVLVQARDVLDRDPAGALAWLASYPIEAGDFREVRALFEDARGRAAIAIIPDVLASAVNTTRDGHVRALLADGRLVDLDPRTRQTSTRAMIAPPEHVACATIAPGGELAFVADAHALTLVDLARGETRRIVVDTALPRESCAFSADGSAIGLALAGGLGWLHVADGKLDTFASKPASAFARAPDGSAIAWTSWPDRLLHVVEPATGARMELATGEANPTWTAFSPDGARVVAVTRSGDLLVWTRDGRLEHTVHACPFAVVNGAWLRRGLALHCQDGTIPVIDVATGAIDVHGPTGPNWGWVGAADGDRVVGLGNGGGAVWNLATGESARIAFDDDVASGWFTPGGAYLAVATQDSGKALVFATPALDARALPGHAGNLSKAVFSARAFAQTGDDGIALCDAPGGACTALPTEAPPSWLAFSADGARLGYGTERASGWFDLADRSRHTVAGALASAAWAPAGDRLALGDNARRLVVVDTRTGATTTLATGALAYDLAWSRDGKRLAWRDEHGNVTVAEPSHDRRWHFDGDAPVNGLSFTPALAFSADGERLYGGTGTPHGGLATWDLATGATSVRAPWHALPIMAIALSPDGRTLATASNDRTVRLLDTATGDATELAGHRAEVWQLAFSPDGTRLASGARDATVRVWDVATGDVAVLRGHDTELRSVAWSLAGDQLASASADRVVVWETARLPRPIADAAGVRAAIEAETSVGLGSDDRPVTPIP